MKMSHVGIMVGEMDKAVELYTKHGFSWYRKSP